MRLRQGAQGTGADRIIAPFDRGWPGCGRHPLGQDGPDQVNVLGETSFVFVPV